jgi:hypothetical protein
VGARQLRVTPLSGRPRSFPRGERACLGRDPGVGMSRGPASSKIPHPEEAATGAVSKSLPRTRSGGRGEVGIRPTRFVRHSRTQRRRDRPGPGFGGVAAPRPGTNTHPEN